MIILHAEPVGAPVARRGENVVGGIKIHPAFKHPGGGIGGELIHDQRVGGQGVSDENQAGQTSPQQMMFAAIHVMTFLFCAYLSRTGGDRRFA